MVMCLFSTIETLLKTVCVCVCNLLDGCKNKEATIVEFKKFPRPEELGK